MTKIRVGFDLSQTAFVGGVGTYAKELAQRLDQISDLEMSWLYASLRQPYTGKLAVKKLSMPPTIFEPLMNKWRWLMVEKLLGPIDIFHSSDWTQPPTKAKKVTTFHDVIPLKYPEWSDPKIVAVHRRRLKLVEAEIDRVIAVSLATKQDLIEVTKIPAEKIVVIYEGVDARFKPPTEAEINQFRRRLSLPDKFVLGIGGVGNRRNLVRARQAVKSLPLLVTHQDIAPISDEEMPLLYASAQLLLYPSLYEGFGLPIIEAMATGTPVVTANIGAMAEIAGSAAVLVNPTNVKSIEQGVEQALAERAKLIKLGLTQAKKFSWQTAAEQTAEVYRGLIKT